MVDVKPQKQTLSFEMERDGIITGLVVYINIETTQGVNVSSHEPSSWANPFIFLPEPLKATKGQVVELDTEVILGELLPKYVFRLRTTNANGGQVRSMNFSLP
eukprot:CAMPEP_0167772546 /NCGR_PEP_ID=MMETSP0111_2-20121227/907_1 /TAXON_ID=91324 /ORGANISM="Lotharella globosa, Strain CCCM811" /LENGTH=102 /DNA_ID=CAMNT_0007662049 /DNA_START=157 /DNA_END=465 /DNA_ORIENTATION=+